MTLLEIERLAEDFALAVSDAETVSQQFEAAVAQLKRRFVAKARAHVGRVATARRALQVAIQESPDLWEKPRTRVFHGVQVGLRRVPGELTWEDDEVLIQKIRRYYVDEIGALIKTVEKPNANGLALLPEDDRKRLGLTVVGAGDRVVLKVVAADLDKFVRALVGNLTEDDDS